MNRPRRNTPNARRMLQRMSVNLSESFTLEQVQALEEALVPRTHQIDVRFLVPLLGKGAYFVLVGGPNKRQQPRTNSDHINSSSAFSNSIALTQNCRNCPNAYRVLSRIPEPIVSTFKPHQIKAMEAALVPRRHIVDIRLALPFLGKGAYLVFAAGPNRRAHYRNLQNRNPFVMPAVIASVVLGATAILGLVQLRGSALLAEPDPVFQSEEAFHPTAVPFKKNRGECEESGRQWIDDQCIDKIHDPVF
ncbi:MAG: hypothetical protein AAFQ63_00485 [Cyanobacteria bacterium J06621_11]